MYVQVSRWTQNMNATCWILFPLIDNQYKNIKYGVMEEDRDKD